MTERQLESLKQLSSYRWILQADREAVRAILAERDDLSQAVEIISDLTAMIEMDPEYTPGTDLYTTGEVAKLFIARVKGGQP